MKLMKRYFQGGAMAMMSIALACASAAALLPQAAKAAGEAGDPCIMDSDCNPFLKCSDLVCKKAPIEEIVVVAPRITPSVLGFGWLPPRLRTIPATVHIPPLAPQEEEEEAEATFTFDRCSRPLGGEYEAGLTPEEQAAIRNRLRRHDDVAWAKAHARDAAGFFSKNFRKALSLIFTTEGEIKTTSPSGNCRSWKISEKSYDDVIARVNADKLKAPRYHLIAYNCQDWADDIEELALPISPQ